MEVVPMTHPDIVQAVAEARRADFLRAAAGRRTDVVVRREARRRRLRIAAWLKGQRRHATPPAGLPNAPRAAWNAR